MSEKHSILVVSKEEEDISRLKKLFDGIYNVDTLSSSAEASTQINNHRERYSLVIIAAEMPVLNGFSFCLSIKMDKNIRNLPIIIYGTIYEFRDKEGISGLRSCEYDKIVKPFQESYLLNLVELNIKRKVLLDRIKDNPNKIIDQETHLFVPAFLEEALNLEFERARKLELTFNCIIITTEDDDIRDNLISIIRNTCRHYDITSVKQNKIILLLPNTTKKDGEYIQNRFYSLIYGLNLELYYFDPETTSPDKFKNKVLGITVNQ